MSDFEFADRCDVFGIVRICFDLIYNRLYSCLECSQLGFTGKDNRTAIIAPGSAGLHFTRPISNGFRLGRLCCFAQDIFLRITEPIERRAVGKQHLELGEENNIASGDWLTRQRVPLTQAGFSTLITR